MATIIKQKSSKMGEIEEAAGLLRSSRSRSKEIKAMITTIEKCPDEEHGGGSSDREKSSSRFLLSTTTTTIDEGKV